MRSSSLSLDMGEVLDVLEPPVESPPIRAIETACDHIPCAVWVVDGDEEERVKGVVASVSSHILTS